MANVVKLADVVASRFAYLTPASEENIERIRADLTNGSKILLNNPHVFKNEAGKWEILAGHDRVEAARRAGWKDVPVRDFSGTLNTDDAILAHFCRENLLRKDVSKATVAGEWLKRHPDWSDGKIADESGCTAEYVGVVRAELVAAGNLQLVGSRVGRDGKVREEKKPREPRSVPKLAKDKPKPAAKKVEPVGYEAPDDLVGALFSKKPESHDAPEPEGSTESNEASEATGVDGTATDSGAGEEPAGASEPEVEPTRALAPKRRPNIAHLMNVIEAATGLSGDATDEEIAAIPFNDLMGQRLRGARVLIDRVLAFHSSQEKSA